MSKVCYSVISFLFKSTLKCVSFPRLSVCISNTRLAFFLLHAGGFTGAEDGFSVGDVVGFDVGFNVGVDVGDEVGFTVGSSVGTSVGTFVGSCV